MKLTDESLKKVSKIVSTLLRDCRIAGLGSGTTIASILTHLRGMLSKQVIFIPSSMQITLVASKQGLNLNSLQHVDSVDVTIDGADEVDHYVRAIKGGGGALVKERVLSKLSQKYFIIVDESKISPKIGLKSKIPVEFHRDTYPLVFRELRERGLKPRLRTDNKGYPKISESGNYIFDVEVSGETSPKELLDDLRKIPGVIDVGIFLKNEITKILICRFNGEVTELRGEKL